VSRDAHLAVTVSTKFEVDTTIHCLVIALLLLIRVQHVSDLHPKFTLRPHHVWQYGRHPTSDR